MESLDMTLEMRATERERERERNKSLTHLFELLFSQLTCLKKVLPSTPGDLKKPSSVILLCMW